MRILFLLTQDLESPSGLGRFWPLARALAQSGYEVQVAALHPNFSTLKQRRYEQDGVEICYVAPMHVIKQGNQKSYYSFPQLVRITLRATWALTKAAFTDSVDIVFVGKPHPMNSIAGLLLKTLRRVMLVVDCDDYEAASGRFSGKWQREIVSFFEKQAPRYADKVTTNTHFMRDKLLSWGVPQEQIVYLPNGIDPDRFLSPDSERVEVERAKLNLIGKKVVTYIGTIGFSSHPVNLLVDAFAHIHAAVPDSVLMIVGGGEDIVRLQAKAAKLKVEHATRFVGRVAPEDIPLYYALSDVTVDPVHDNDAARGRCPLKLFESWACGVPFVTADVGDRALLMGNPPAGALARAGDAKSFADTILQVLGDSAVAKVYCRQGLARVKNYYWDRLARSLNDIYAGKR